MEEIIIRQKIDDDNAFIYATWLKSHKYDSQFGKEIPRHIYFQNHSEIVKEILERATTLIAAAKEDPEVILGYLCYESRYGKNICHYLFVKEAFRKMGIANTLFRATPIELNHKSFCSHLTNQGRIIEKKLGLIYCPYLWR